MRDLIVFSVLCSCTWLVLGLGLVFSAIIPDKPPFRLGSSVWLCKQCHAVYAQPMKRCPRGHVVAEHQDVTERMARFGISRDILDIYDAYATRLMYIDDPGDTAQLATLSKLFSVQDAGFVP